MALFSNLNFYFYYYYFQEVVIGINIFLFTMSYNYLKVLTKQIFEMIKKEYKSILYEDFFCFNRPDDRQKF